MKKIIALLLVPVLALGLLAGCGYENTVNDARDTAEGKRTPQVTPVPDYEDGVVTDRDGFIEENEEGTAAEKDGQTSRVLPTATPKA